MYPRSGSHVLVVDDEPVVASSLAAMLRMNGFSARFFTCPLEALAAARSGKAQEGFSADSAEGAAQADGLLDGERPGQRSLQVGFHELHLPSLTVEERHEDPVAGSVVTAHVGQYRRMQGEDVHRAKPPLPASTRRSNLGEMTNSAPTGSKPRRP